MLKTPSQFTPEVRTRMRDGNGNVRIEHIWKPGDELGSPTRMYSRLILEPGCSIGWHVHQNEEEIFYILAGNGIVNDNGCEKNVTAGDSVITRSGEGHSIACTGDAALEVLAVIVKYV